MPDLPYPKLGGPYPELTDDGVEESRRLIGVPLRRSPHHQFASRSAISGFTKAIGSRNPLFLNEEYTRYAPYGKLVAHPTFLYSIDDTVIAPKLPGILVVYGGTEWEFHKIVGLNDHIRAEARLVDVQEKVGRFCGRMIVQIGEVVYSNERNDIVARARSTVLRTPAGAAKDYGKYRNIKKHSYTQDAILEIQRAYDKEEIRGDNARYWEDVQEGERLTPVIKGPLTSEDMREFITTVSPVLIYQLWVRYRMKHPGAAFLDEKGMPETWEARLLLDNVAQECGFPAAHDTGYQRICWLDNLVTNWMGDAAFLRRLGAQIILPNIYADTTWCKGKVARKYEYGSDKLVDLDVWCENQRGEVTARGYATVQLCTRELQFNLASPAH